MKKLMVLMMLVMAGEARAEVVASKIRALCYPREDQTPTEKTFPELMVYENRDGEISAMDESNGGFGPLESTFYFGIREYFQNAVPDNRDFRLMVNMKLQRDARGAYPSYLREFKGQDTREVRCLALDRKQDPLRVVRTRGFYVGYDHNGGPSPEAAYEQALSDARIACGGYVEPFSRPKNVETRYEKYVGSDGYVDGYFKCLSSSGT